MSQFEVMGFTPKQIQAARRYAVRTDLALAMALESGKLQCASHVTREGVLAWASRCRDSAKQIINGERDNNFTIWQRMNTYLTGECVAFLPK